MNPSRRSLLRGFLALPVAARFAPVPLDDTAYIQGLIDAAVARGEDVVHIPAGNYRCRFPALVPKSITRIKGSSTGRTVFHA